jgi:FkbM family methyltransferase
MRKVVRDWLAEFPLVDGLFRRFVWSRIHFPEVEMRFIDSLGPRSIDIAVDVGAATGSYSWILNRKSRQVFSFEPGLRHAQYLERVIFGTTITLVKSAVGNECAVVTMYTPGSDTVAHHSATVSKDNPVAASLNAETRLVEQVTLDQYFTGNIQEGRSVDLIKIDVEGYESEVLEGGKALISRFQPLIFCEIEKRHNAEYMRVFNYLRSAGYVSYIFQAGKYEVFDGDSIEHLQSEGALRTRVDGSYDPLRNLYVNNFVFQHALSRIKVAGR